MASSASSQATVICCDICLTLRASPIIPNNNNRHLYWWPFKICILSWSLGACLTCGTGLCAVSSTAPCFVIHYLEFISMAAYYCALYHLSMCGKGRRRRTVETWDSVSSWQVLQRLSRFASACERWEKKKKNRKWLGKMMTKCKKSVQILACCCDWRWERMARIGVIKIKSVYECTQTVSEWKFFALLSIGKSPSFTLVFVFQCDVCLSSWYFVSSQI